MSGLLLEVNRLYIISVVYTSDVRKTLNLIVVKAVVTA